MCTGAPFVARGGHRHLVDASGRGGAGLCSQLDSQCRLRSPDDPPESPAIACSIAAPNVVRDVVPASSYREPPRLATRTNCAIRPAHRCGARRLRARSVHRTASRRGCTRRKPGWALRPWSTSGAVNAGDPVTMPVGGLEAAADPCDAEVRPAAGSPYSVSRIFAGLTSRCSVPSRCAVSRAPAIFTPTCSVSCQLSGPVRTESVHPADSVGQIRQHDVGPTRPQWRRLQRR